MDEIKERPDGIYTISNQDYHACSRVSRSALSELKKSPLHYWDKYINPDREPSVSARPMVVGEAVHTLILEQDAFNSRFAVCKKLDLRRNEDKKYKMEFDIFAKGKHVINEEELYNISKIADCILAHETATKIIQGALIEHSVFWTDPETGVACKARPDIWHKEHGIICDLKTSIDPSPEAFIHEVYKYDYHIQAAMQIDALQATTGILYTDFTYIVAPKTRPFYPYIYTLSDNVIELGRTEYKTALKLLSLCQQSNKWLQDRNQFHELNFSEFRLNTNAFNRLIEVYHATANT